MAQDEKTSLLPSAGPLTGSEFLPGVQDGGNVKILVSEIIAAASPGGSGSTPVETLTKAAFETKITNSELVAGKYYLVTGAFTSTVFATNWDVLCIADSVNTVKGNALIWNTTVPTPCSYDPSGPSVIVGTIMNRTITPTIANTWALQPYEVLSQSVLTIAATVGNVEVIVAQDSSVLLFKDARNVDNGQYGQYFPATDTFVPNDGEYTPTLTEDGSVVTAVTASTAQYSRVGDRLFISAQIALTCDFGAGTEGTIDFTLPEPTLLTSASSRGGFSVDIGVLTPNHPIYGYEKNGQIKIQCHDNSFNDSFSIYFWTQIKLS